MNSLEDVMGKLGMVARGLGAACVVTALFAGCGPTPQIGPVTPPVPDGPAPSGKSAAANEAYKKCKAEEDKEGGDGARIQRCYEAWLDEYRDAGDAGQLRHAQRMAAKHDTHPDHPDGPKPDEHKDKEQKAIVIDEHPKPSGGGHQGGDNPFPPQTVGYEECWRGAPLTGNYVTDYNNLVTRCGKPTGMLPYSKVMEGELSDQHKGDVYTVKLLGGGCYRFFAVAGGSIKDLDIGLATMEDKMLAADKYTQPVAIIEWKQPVCVQHDVMFKFIVARDGGGQGGYGFGIWFKPGTG